MVADDPPVGWRARTHVRPGPRGRWLQIALVSACWISCLAAAILYGDSLTDAWHRAIRVHWAALAMVLPMFLVWNHAAAIGWRVLLERLAPGDAPSAIRLTLIRIQGQAVNLVLPLFGLGGDLTRTMLLTRESTRLGVGAPSVALDSMTSLTAGLIFSIVGVSLGSAALPGGAISLATLVGVAAVALVGLYAVPSMARRAARWPLPESWSPVRSTLRHLAGASVSLRASFRWSIVWHLVERCLMAAEIWVLSWGLGLHLGVSQTLFVAGVLTASSFVLFFVPGQLGVAEGGLSVGFAALGLPAEIGLGAALIRRARQLLFMCAGLAWLALSQSRATVRARSPRPASSAGG